VDGGGLKGEHMHPSTQQRDDWQPARDWRFGYGATKLSGWLRPIAVRSAMCVGRVAVALQGSAYVDGAGRVRSPVIVDGAVTGRGRLQSGARTPVRGILADGELESGAVV
jgi:hypothetical protein